MNNINIKGIIDTNNIKSEQGFSWVREIIKKAKEDSLNIKSEEFEAVSNIIFKLEKKYNKLEQFYIYMSENMTKAQQSNYFKDIIDDEIKLKVIKNFIND